MKKDVYLIIKFTSSFQENDGSIGTWDYYAKLYPTGTLRVFDPAFPSRECESSHYFSIKVQNFITNKNNRYFDLSLIQAAFIDVAVRECFFCFRDIHFGYEDPYIPTVRMSVKFDPGVYETPVQIKSNVNDCWIQATSKSKVLCVDRKGQHKTLQDE